MNKTKMHCGCEFETDINGRIIFDPDTEKLRKDCPITWDLICSGNTKGVFQLEKQKDNAKKVEPHNLEELSDLIAIIRPGVTESFIKGKNLTNHYIDRKHHKDDVEYIHQALEPILKSTQGILVYQEQALSIAKNIAGYNLQEAEILRKAIGKKIAELMSKIESEFIEKAVQTGILNREEAEQVFSWIKASQRYSFNKCLAMDTVVITPDGEKLISEVAIGDKVLAPKDENTDNFVEVIDVINNGHKELYEVTLSTGDTIKCTLDHKFLCSDNIMHTLKEILDKDLDVWCID